MNPASVVTADYSTVINTIRGHLANGSQMSGFEMQCTIALIKDAVSRMSTASTAITTFASDVAAQMVILQAKGTADASAEIDTADTTTAASAATCAAALTVPTYTSSVGMDG